MRILAAPCIGMRVIMYPEVKLTNFPSSLPAGKESDSEDFLHSGSVSTVLLDTPTLTDPEKSPSPTPVTASPIHDEFNMNIQEEVSLFSFFNSFTPWKYCLFWTHVRDIKTRDSENIFFRVSVLVIFPNLLDKVDFLWNLLRSFIGIQLNLFSLIRWDQEIANSCICHDNGS